MHYSEKMKNEITEKNQIILNIEDQLTDLMRYLASDKFHGFENNFVNANEMLYKINEIRNSIK